MTFIYDHGTGSQPQYRDQLTLDSASGQVLRWEPFSSQQRGRQWRAWVRYLHTGEALGWFGQGVAAIAALGTAWLVFTGFVLAWIRFQNWQRCERAED